jgi:DNA-binding beta-propeller fold protein YncE
MMPKNLTKQADKLSKAALIGASILVGACSASGGSDGSGGGHGGGVHMAELSADLTKIYLTNSDKDMLKVVDAKGLTGDTSTDALEQRAYIVSRDSSELAFIDLRTWELTRKRTYPVVREVQLGKHPTHLSLSRDGRVLAVMDENEGSGAVSFVDTETDVEMKRLEGFFTPHFMRFDHDGRFGYVANIGAHHITRVDLETLEIDSTIPLDGFDDQTPAEEEGGFGDAQIDADGVLFAAHRATGRVLVLDTRTNEKRPEVRVGRRPWIAFAEHPFLDLPRLHVVPNFGDKSLSIIGSSIHPDVIGTLPGDEEAYGVNFSSLTPNKAFVMNRMRKDIAVLDLKDMVIADRIPVGGNTETAATTADGKYIIAAVSSANRVVVVDAETNKIVHTYDNVGNYPWSVTIPYGQNYCH